MMALYLAIFLVILLLIGFPMFIVMFLPSVTALKIFLPHIPTFTLVQRAISGMSPFPLIAVPLFIFAADLMMEGQMSRRLTSFAEALVGHFTGGLAHTTILACLIFGSVSGSTQATVAAIGSNMQPVLMRRGYSQSFTTALVINASDVSQLIPPSIFLIVFGVITGTSIAALFMAGIVPGIFLGLAFMGYSWIWAKRNKIQRNPRANIREVLIAAKEAAGPLGFMVVIIGGIYSGIFSPTEAAGIAVGYSFVLETFVYRSIHVRDVSKIALRSGTTTALVFILVGGAEAFVWLLTVARVPHTIMQLMVSLQPSPVMLLFIINLTFFIALMFFNPISAMIVLTPLFMPITKAYGIDPIHLGALIALNAAIGSATPPFGVDIFTACAIFRLPYERVVKGVPPFIFAGLVVLVILTFFPGLVLFLPGFLPH
jgi:tripartite ATP-independent transporter DctM subunit